ncbi:hypothetical protein CsSME_00032522 [Camellia sinensis var. sinensis]
MATGFKVLISRIISSFQFYRSKNPSNFSENLVPSFLQLSPNPVFIDCPPATPPFSNPTTPPSSPTCPPTSHPSAVGSELGTQYTSEDDLTESLEFKWSKTPHHKIYNSSISGDSDNDLFPPPPPHMAAKKKQRSKKKKAKTRHRIITSSTDSELFGDERDGEEEGIVTLVSFSRNHKKRMKGVKCNVSKGRKVWSPKIESPVRLSGLKKLIPSFEAKGKVKESFAAVKKSKDPYEDFKRSMMEILEKQMFDVRDLEQLLVCFFSLNSRHRYRAFTDIWEILFFNTS